MIRLEGDVPVFDLEKRVPLKDYFCRFGEKIDDPNVIASLKEHDPELLLLMEIVRKIRAYSAQFIGYDLVSDKPI